MGAPAFQYEELFKKYNVRVFSANFSLYGDLSQRVMKIIVESAPEVEIYSIDEAFIKYDGCSFRQIIAYTELLRKTILKCIGIPVSIGIASTKTLAKAANEMAKKGWETKKYPEGLYGISASSEQQELVNLPVADVWGIGRKLSLFLNKHGIYTAAQLAACEDEWVKKHLTFSGLKTVRELRGIEAVPFEEVYPAKKSIISSKSFGSPVSSLQEMREAVASFTSRAAEKLREENEVAAHIGVAITTNFHSKHHKQYYNSQSLKLLQPTAHTPELISSAVTILDRIYKEGYRYKKAVVYLFGLHDRYSIQQGMFENTLPWGVLPEMKKKNKLMSMVDRLNREMGSGIIHFAREGVSKRWYQKRKKVSPKYTTRWKDLPLVR